MNISFSHFTFRYFQEGGATPDVTHNCVKTINAPFSKPALLEEYTKVVEVLLNMGKKVVIVYQVLYGFMG
jgi:hypothetical protein